MNFKVDIPEGGEFPDQWIAWGSVIPSTRNPQHAGKYFMLRLPFYKYQECVYSGMLKWHQFHIFERRWPNLNVNEKWIFEFFPVRSI